jgi:tyrosine-protein phosphatase YwqE
MKVNNVNRLVQLNCMCAQSAVPLHIYRGGDVLIVSEVQQDITRNREDLATN